MGFSEVLDRLEKSGIAQRMMDQPLHMQTCLVCGKMCPLPDILTTEEAKDRMCESCRNLYSDMAVIMCRCCGSLVGFMRAGISDTGFNVRRGMTLHTEWCPHCNKPLIDKVKALPVLEIEKFNNMRRNNALAGAIQKEAEDAFIKRKFAERRKPNQSAS